MKNCKYRLFCRVTAVLIIGLLWNNASFGQCPTITDFDVATGCENVPFESLMLASTADSVEIISFPFGGNIDPYTSPGGTSLGIHEVPANDTLLVQPYPHSLAPGFYLFYAIAHPVPTDPKCIPPSDVKSVEVFEFVDLQTIDGTSCQNSRVNLTDYISGVTNANFVAFFNTATDAMNATNQIQEYDYPNATRDYYVLAKASNSTSIPEDCVNISSFTITILPSPTVDAGIDQSICEGENAQLSASGGNTYAWSPASLLSDANIASPTTNIDITTQYGVTITDANGCSSTDQVTINVTQLPICPPISGSQN